MANATLSYVRRRRAQVTCERRPDGAVVLLVSPTGLVGHLTPKQRDSARQLVVASPVLLVSMAIVAGAVGSHWWDGAPGAALLGALVVQVLALAAAARIDADPVPEVRLRAGPTGLNVTVAQLRATERQLSVPIASLRRVESVWGDAGERGLLIRTSDQGDFWLFGYLDPVTIDEIAQDLQAALATSTASNP